MDFLGNKLKVGDEVVFMMVGYKVLKRGIIKSISNRMCIISHEKLGYSKTETRQYKNRVVKIKQ